MTQVECHQYARCPKCGADRGEPCTTLSGREAERVHYGRPYWSSKVGVPREANWARRKAREAWEPMAPGTPHGWWLAADMPHHMNCVDCNSRKPFNNNNAI